jgi:SH3 domain-containing YSC84-like protein 1
MRTAALMNPVLLGVHAQRGCVLGAVVAALLSALPLVAVGQGPLDAKLAARAERAGEIISELVREPDHSPPRSLLARAVCVAAVPGVVQVGLEVGAKVGFGMASCRTPGGWSLPTFVALKGGTFGLQIGVESADVVLVFLNENAPRILGASSFDLGGQASAAAGPIGRDLAAETDYKLSAEIFSYSRTKGFFAGIDLAGTKWEIDREANEAAYGPTGGGSASNLLQTGAGQGPALVQPFITSLERNIGPHN